MKIRLNLSAREVEVEGPDAVVRGWYERLKDTIAEMKAAPPVQPAAEVPPTSAGSPMPPLTSQPFHGIKDDADEPFGEYLHRFRNDVTDVDRILIAGAHAQSASDDNTFHTVDASERLLEQGFRVTNPAECVRRNQSSRRIIRVKRGVFRLSEPGRRYLEGLRHD